MPDRPCCTGSIRLLLVMLPVENFSGPEPAGSVHYQMNVEGGGEDLQ